MALLQFGHVNWRRCARLERCRRWPCGAFRQPLLDEARARWRRIWLAARRAPSQEDARCATAAHRHGHDAELDALRDVQSGGSAFLLDLEARERARTGIANLRVLFNRVHGYAIEVGSAQTHKVPDDWRRRQTLKNGERYTSPELKRFEDQALSAGGRARWRASGGATRPCSTRCSRTSRRAGEALARALAHTTCWPAGRARDDAGWCRPEFVAIRASTSTPAATLWSRPGWPKPAAATSSPTTAGSTREPEWR